MPRSASFFSTSPGMLPPAAAPRLRMALFADHRKPRKRVPRLHAALGAPIFANERNRTPMTHVTQFSLAVLLTLATFGASPQAAPSTSGTGKIDLAPHRAVYDLKLATSRGKRPIEAVRGRILYDFTGNSC